ncbi:MAG: class I SAM-dependent methyltransferase [Flavobacteriales bacterium]|nr:class I SAM-dependent methyltransferase [Flavobacteriales bacterium]
MNEKTNTRCIACDSTQIRDLRGFEVSQLLKCDMCSHVFQKRIPEESELDQLYVYGLNQYRSPITVKRYTELLDSFEPFRKTNKLLDVGCGAGFFLEIAREKGWDAYGTERNQQALSIGTKKGIKMYDENWLDEPTSNNLFDVITAFELIEHIGNPNPLFGQITNALRPGGVVYTTTPNFNAINRYLLRNKWDDVIAYPDHLSYFSTKSLDALWESHGLKKIYSLTNGYSVTHFRRGMKISNHQVVTVNSDDEVIRTAFESNRVLGFIKKVLNYVLSLLGVGESLKSLYVKEG